MDAETARCGSGRRSAAPSELKCRCDGLVDEEVTAEAAFGVADGERSGRQGREQGQLGRRQQGGLPDMAADLEVESGVERLAATGVGGDEPPAFGDAHVHTGT